MRSPIVDPEAVMFRIDSADEPRGIRDDIHAAIAWAWGAEHVPDPPEWTHKWKTDATLPLGESQETKPQL